MLVAAFASYTINNLLGLAVDVALGAKQFTICIGDSSGFEYIKTAFASFVTTFLNVVDSRACSSFKPGGC